MNLRDLQYLVALADHGHFSRAANACFVSQPALSMQIMKLEHHLGVQLIERNKKTVLLTAQGEKIVTKARSILNDVKEMKLIADHAKDPMCGELKIGLFPTLAPYLLPLIMPKLAHCYPKITFFLVEAQSAALLSQLNEGSIDAAFLAAPVVEKSLTAHDLFEEEFYLAVSKAHSLAHLPVITADDLNKKELLLLEEGHCMRDQALSLCQYMAASETQDFRATSLETLRHMVIANAGITLMPALACHPADGIIYIPFASTKPMRRIGFYYRASSSREILFMRLIKTIKQVVARCEQLTLIGSAELLNNTTRHSGASTA